MIAGIVAALAALVYWTRCAKPGASRQRSAVKTASVGLLVVAGVLADAPPAIILGLALGSAGDLALSRPGQKSFLVGMAVFAAGHLAYAGWFWAASDGAILVLPSLIMLALAVSTEFWLIPHTGALRWPVRGYVAIIALMAIAATGLPAHRWGAQTGAALFVLSDLLLAIHIFRLPRPWLAYLLWPAYWLGQMMILAGSL